MPFDADAINNPDPKEPSTRSKAMAAFGKSMAGSGGGQDRATSMIAEQGANNAREASEVQQRTQAVQANTNREMQSYKRGGKVRETGKARLHKGERAASRSKGYR